MKKKTNDEMTDELRPEYDLRKLLKGGIRGKYTKQYRAGTNLVRLDPDVRREFPDENSINEALRLVLRLTRVTKTATTPAVRGRASARAGRGNES